MTRVDVSRGLQYIYAPEEAIYLAGNHYCCDIATTLNFKLAALLQDPQTFA